jgi:HSP20 family protein
MTLPKRRSAVAERREPLREFDQIAERMPRMLGQTLGDGAPLLADPATWTPPVGIEETDDAYLIEAEVPGVKRGDVDIELVGNRVILPVEVDSDKIDANLDDGILTVGVPKSQRDQRRKISVKA